MKIAIASEGLNVSGHFGHCPFFTVYEVENKDIKNKIELENPGHKPGALPVFLKENGVDVIVSGGMGARAIELFNENNIEVITGATGSIEENVKLYIDGKLESSGSVCHNHEHSHECGNH